MCEINICIGCNSIYWVTFKWDEKYTLCLKIFGEDVLPISLVGFLLVKCDGATHCRLPQNSEHYDELFCLVLSIICLIFYIKYKFLDIVFFCYCFWTLFDFMHFYYPTNIISNTFTFGLWLNLWMAKYKCVILSWKTTCLLDTLKWCGIF